MAMAMRGRRPALPAVITVLSVLAIMAGVIWAFLTFGPQSTTPKQATAAQDARAGQAVQAPAWQFQGMMDAKSALVSDPQGQLYKAQLMTDGKSVIVMDAQGNPKAKIEVPAAMAAVVAAAAGAAQTGNAQIQQNGQAATNTQTGVPPQQNVQGVVAPAQQAQSPVMQQIPAGSAPAGQQVPGGQLGNTTQAQVNAQNWGPAGPAPQVVDVAANVLQTNNRQLLTVLYPRIGDSTVIGWVLGTSSSESAGTVVTASNIPSGVCVDYNHNASTLSGSVSRSAKLTGDWTRALLSSVGQFSGTKATFYWTQCDFTGLQPVSPPPAQAPAGK